MPLHSTLSLRCRLHITWGSMLQPSSLQSTYSCSCSVDVVFVTVVLLSDGMGSGLSGREERGEVFPGPAMFGGPHHHSKILKMEFQVAFFLTSNMHSPLSIAAVPWTPQGELTTLPQTHSGMVSGHLSRFLHLGAYRKRL